MDEREARRGARFLPYRPLIPAAAAFAAGILARECLKVPPAVAWGGVAVAVVVFPIATATGARRLALVALHALLAGAGWVRLDLAAAPLPSHRIAGLLRDEPTLAKLAGLVATEPHKVISPPMPLAGDSGWLADTLTHSRFDLDVERVAVEGGWAATCGRVRVTLYEPRSPLRCGDAVVVTGMVARPRPATNPGQLDLARLYRRKGIDAVMAVGGGVVQVQHRGVGWRLGYLAQRARSWLRERIEATLAGSQRARVLLAAVLLGDRAELDEEFEAAFQRSGTMHLLAISGLHVGIVAWLVWHVAALVGLGRGASGATVLAAVILYAAVVGFTPAVTRASVMTGALVLSIVGRRQLDLLQAAALAALVLLVVRPHDLFQAGFQLSFAAVGSIVCLREELLVLLRPRERLEERLVADEQVTAAQRVRFWLRRRALGAATVSLAAWLGVLPLTAWYFNLFSPITVLANLVAVPLLGLVVALGVGHVAVAAALPFLAPASGLLVRATAAGLTRVVESAARVPLGWTYCATPAFGWVVGYYALGLVVVARRRLGLSGKHAAMLWMAGVWVYLMGTLRAPRPDGLEVTVLDVKHGSAAVARYPDGSVVVCDCGSYGRQDVGRWVAAPALWHWGARRIDLLVVSHADVDHINGIPALLERLPVGRVLYSPVLERNEAGLQLLGLLDARRIPREAARAGDRLTVGAGNVVEVLGPTDWSLRAYPENQNENSLVIRLEHGGRRVLVAGDIQAVGSTVLMRGGADLRADVLVVPHHGCAMPNADEFVRAVRPAVAIASNRTEQLVPETIAAYERSGARVFATCWDGAVTVRIQDGELEPLPFHERRRHER